MKKSKMLLAIGGTTVGLLALGVGVAFAGIPGASGAISACRNNLTGGLRAIDAEAGQSCNSLFETGLSWNQTGPQGPAGPAGPQGPSGALNIEVVSALIHVQSSSNNTKVAQAMCPTGKVATGGGFNGIQDFVRESKPIVVNNKPVGWSFIGSTGLEEGASAYVVCVNES